MKRRRGPVPTEAFLSHSSADRRFVDKLAKALRKSGIRVWYSRRHIVGATQWHDEIGRALGRCDWFILVLSRRSVRSDWVKRELLYALRENRYRNHIVPVVTEPCRPGKLSWTLDAIQFVDFRPGFEEGLRQLVRIWGIR